ncbi:SDR family oxidoreductase [Oceanobacillus kimchii]|uniref:SDR family oxidoreductase n=1 Tax=Oceanobacillus kimchii TaxID=746691 RepID=UPI0021A897BA|nr:SDR family oxidoreductase [Oceanobacillus kimchii]MCT1577174.1 SDR family oxidoreductase [Oceanobacillus kimchii]MCT2135244.1 SDR family oxidoreductase [Oceanobacillus kimchii]
MTITGQIAVVTGVSHGNGIGAAACRKLAEQGCSIFFTHYQSKDNWAYVFQEEIRNKGVVCESMEVNLFEIYAYKNILNTVTSKIGTPSILVNNAAHSTRDGYRKLTSEIIDKHYQVNMRQTMMLSVAFVGQLEMEGHKQGRIINLTSGQFQGPMIDELAYVATKGAISAFTLSLSAEVAHLGITVNAVNPGPTDTGWMNGELKKELESKFLFGRVGQPMDAAKLIAFLASEDAAWITGQIINSEGAFLRK